MSTPDSRSTVRRIPLDAAFNVRDLGGYPTATGRATRWRRLLRADGLHRCTDGDVETLSGLVHTVIDLRSTAELEEHGSFPLDRVAGSYHHLPVIDRTWDGQQLAVDVAAPAFLSARYLEMTEQGRPAYGKALRLLADPDSYPVVFHCAAGKDRTGVLAALVLSLCGVSDEVIAEDYGHSREAVQRFKTWLGQRDPEVLKRLEDVPEVFFDAPPAAMLAFLDGLRERHGSVRGYVRQCDLDDEAIASLQDNLLAPPGASG